MNWERIDYKPEWYCLQCGARYEVGSNPPTVANGGAVRNSISSGVVKL